MMKFLIWIFHIKKFILSKNGHFYEKIGRKGEPICIDDEIPFDVPDCWEWCRFGYVVDFSLGKTPPRKEPIFWDNATIPWVAISDMVDGKIINCTQENVNNYALEKSFKGILVPKGTLLMSFKLTVGKVSILGLDAVHNEAIISIKPFIDENNCFRDYLFRVLPLISQTGDTKSAIKGKTLNSKSLNKLLIPLPPLNEQGRIVNKIEDIMPFIEEYGVDKEKLDKLNSEFPDKLKSSILQEAIQGKLVPQDPDDEPASVLLEKIKEEKERLIKEKKIKRNKNESYIFSESKQNNIMNSEDKEIINEFIKVRNLNKRTVYGYNNAIKLYTNFNNMSLSELLKEAEKDEENGVRWKNRKIKQRLLNFRAFLQRDYLISTVKVHFQRILTIYRHFEIEIHNLPSINLKNTNNLKPIMFEDLPTKEIIKDAVNITNPIMKAIILFITSSGCARQETLNITIQDFIDATREYHNSDDIYEIITILIKRHDVVPTFKLKRQKTNKFYFTFCSPEAVSYILDYLIISKRKLKNEDKLFKTNLDYLNNYFNEINDSLNLGKVRKYNRFRSHMLRKFHASALYNHENGLSLEEIDALQGRGKDNTHSAYFMEDPIKLKKKYVKILDAILIKF